MCQFYRLQYKSGVELSVNSGSSRAILIAGGRKKEQRKKKQNIHIHISGQSSMQDYLTVPKTIRKTEENAHIFHQQIPQ